MSPPIIVFYKAAGCHHCDKLFAKWGKTTALIRSKYPDMRFLVVPAKDMTGDFDPYLAPKSLQEYNKWFPMVLFVPGATWDAATASLGPHNNAPLKEGVQILNGNVGPTGASLQYKIDFMNPQKMLEWVTSCMESRASSREYQTYSDPFAGELPRSSFLAPVANSNRTEDTCSSLRLVGRPR